MVQNLKKVLKSKISIFFSFLRHEVPFKAKNNREAVVVCAIHVVKRPSKRSVLVEMKTRAKNFSSDEISSLVDLVLENKSKLFGALSCSLTFDEKNNVWAEIANEISQSHGSIRSKEDVSKKLSNVLAKHKPIISDKVLSARKTGGGSPEAELTELEAKLKSIKGKELFKGIQGGIDFCSASPITPLSDSDMSIVEEMKPPKKQKFSDESLTDTTLKKALLETEQEKIGLLRNMNNKMDKVETS